MSVFRFISPNLNYSLGDRLPVMEILKVTVHPKIKILASLAFVVE